VQHEREPLGGSQRVEYHEQRDTDDILMARALGRSEQLR
jgi:hypothetical protein